MAKMGVSISAYTFHTWAPDVHNWPESWMGVDEDLEYGRRMMPYFEGFLQSLYEEGIARKTFVLYRDNLWLLGGTIIKSVSIFDEYETEPLEAIHASVIGDGVLPDDCHLMEEDELKSFVRMCRRFEKFLDQNYGAML